MGRLPFDWERDQEPSPLQMLRQEWQDDVAYYEEQISNARILLQNALNPPTNPVSLATFHKSIEAWLGPEP